MEVRYNNRTFPTKVPKEPKEPKEPTAPSGPSGLSESKSTKKRLFVDVEGERQWLPAKLEFSSSKEPRYDFHVRVPPRRAWPVEGDVVSFTLSSAKERVRYKFRVAEVRRVDPRVISEKELVVGYAYDGPTHATVGSKNVGFTTLKLVSGGNTELFRRYYEGEEEGSPKPQSGSSSSGEKTYPIPKRRPPPLRPTQPRAPLPPTLEEEEEDVKVPLA